MLKPLQEEGVCYFQENFRLIQETDDDILFFIEVRDQTLVGAHDLGRVTFNKAGIQREFNRSTRMGRHLRRKGDEIRGDGMASEQIVRMMEERPENNTWYEGPDAENMRKRMWEAGFAPHPLSNGGVI